MDREYQICTRCVMDTVNDFEIEFDENGVCNNCTNAIARMDNQLIPSAERPEAFKQLVEKVKAAGKGKEYDCIMGVSGGVDSSYVAYLVKEAGLRPLAVHFDNGWDSELAVDNIKQLLEKLDIELYTHVVDWEEFKDLQLSFLKASVANAEAPTDHGIHALLFGMANKFGIRYILSGSNLTTEAITPYSYGHFHQDLRHLKALQRRFGTKKLKTFPKISLFHYIYYVFVRGIRQVPFLNYIDYNKEEAKQLLMDKFGWRDYGGKHYESVWTRFHQGYYLVEKFGLDKRRAHLSSLIASGQITRDEALKEMEKPPYDKDVFEQDKTFVMKKFGLNEEQFNKIMTDKPVPAYEYPSNYFLFHKLKKYKNAFRKIATSA